MIRLTLGLLFLGACSGEKPEPSGDDTSVDLPDQDGDGHTTDQDCDDTDATVYVGAPELCDDKDNDCDSEIDEGAGDTSFYADADGDLYGAGDGVVACEAPAGMVARDGDCDDGDAAVNPGAEEVCNEKDDDCDNQVDEGTAAPDTWYTDGDGDGHGAGRGVESCTPVDGSVTSDGDCDDGDASIHPGATEVCDQVDQDCDGTLDEGTNDGVAYYSDRDGDTWGEGAATYACGQPALSTTRDGDCDDRDRAVNPDATEVCDGIDNDCDGTVDQGATDASTWYADTDNDSYGAGAAVEACAAPSGYVANDDDCNDADRRVNPRGTEICNGVDDDCDGAIDDGASDAYTLYPDGDSDGFGADSGAITSCSAVSGYTTAAGDCDDAEAAVNPDATEVCDGIDNDCSGVVDGADAADAYYVWPDTDRDGYGAGRGSLTCTTGAGFVANDDDCDDSNRDVSPAADEVCDRLDNDCDGDIDEDDAIDAVAGYADADADGFGDAADYDVRCFPADNALDCNDADPTEPHVVNAASTSAFPRGTLADPWPTIQEGIDHAGECVLVEDGLYVENVDFGGRDVAVMSRGGAGRAIIQSAGAGAVVVFNSGETSGAELRGFTLTGGSGFEEETTTSTSCGSSTTCTEHFVTRCGGGLYVDGATPTLTDLVIQANSVVIPPDSSDGIDSWYYFSFGGGMCLRNSTLSLTGVSFLENYAQEGGGAWIESTASLTMSQSQFLGNAAESGAGVAVDGGTLRLTNVLLAWNIADAYGAGVWAVDATTTLTNVTIGECSATEGGGLTASGSASVTLLNSIVYGSDAGDGVVVGSGATFTGSYSDVYGNLDAEYTGVSDPTGTLGNLSVDPLFADVSLDGDIYNDDWSLSASSPVINRGSSVATYNDVDGSRNDMGAYGGPQGGW